MQPPGSPSGSAVAAGGVSATGEVTWEEYSIEAVESYQRQGRAVFVDFTAAWCLSCQVNKRTVLSSNRTEEAFSEADVALLRADWTRRDARIADALQSLGRSGVPVYALYPPVPGAAPELLPEILTHGIVLRALERLPESTALR
ncbi:MAG: thiol:disulfide interchange protein, partial [Gemmatimonadales bacterium]